MHQTYTLYDLLKINNVIRREEEELRATKYSWDEGFINEGSSTKAHASCGNVGPVYSRIVIQLKANLIMGGVRL